MVRIIDSDAINKRVFADIANTFQHSQQITGENTVQNFEVFLNGLKPQTGSNDANAAAMDNFNFNGIEFSKIKQLINYIQTHKKEFKFDRKLIELTNNKQTTLDYFTVEDTSDPDNPPTEVNMKESGDYGIVLNNIKKEIAVDNAFDGRNSFIYPRFVVVYKDLGASKIDCTVNDTNWTNVDPRNSTKCEEKVLSNSETKFEFYKPNIEKSMHFGLSEKKPFMDANEFIRCWAASISDAAGCNSIVVDKGEHTIRITSSVHLAYKNFGFDRAGIDKVSKLNPAILLNHNWITRVYLDVFLMYWRDK